ncbi:MAG: hypothetical protein LBJ44_07300 [Propionibacteriaceae bacterium]|nr:hypothetical protein [Propionibacteriaceae bacterium]
MARAVGLTKEAIRKVQAGRTSCLNGSKADAILRLSPVDLGSPVGCQRRLRALVAVGWPALVLAGRLGRHVSAVNLVLAGRGGVDGVRRPTASAAMITAVMRLYDQIGMVDPGAGGVGPGAVESARRRAAGAGWPGPLAWDDDAIDDPDACPQGLAGDDTPDAEPPDDLACLIEALAEIRDQGVNDWAEAAARVTEAKPDSLRRRLKRHHRDDVLAWFPGRAAAVGCVSARPIGRKRPHV